MQNTKIKQTREHKIYAQREVIPLHQNGTKKRKLPFPSKKKRYLNKKKREKRKEIRRGKRKKITNGPPSVFF